MRVSSHRVACALALSAGAAFAQAPAEKVPAPSPTVQAPFIPQPVVPSPAVPSPAVPVPAVPSPAIPSPSIPRPATGEATPRELPPTPAELVAEVSEGDVVGRCLPEVTLGDAAMPPRTEAATAPRRAPARRVMLAFDASGSMAARLGAGSKMEAARAAAARFLDGLPPEVEVGLVVFGHTGNARAEGRAASCAGAEARLAPGADRGQLRAELDRLRPVGWTPLASAMERAVASFGPSEREGEQLLLVISDGVETCGGNPVEVARRLNTGPLRVVVDIVGFDIAERERAALRAVAEAGGGGFVNVTSTETAADALRRAQAANLEALQRSRAQSAASLATSRNQANINLAATRARSCVIQAITRENSALLQRVNRLYAEGVRAPDLLPGAQAALNARHAILRQGVEDYVAALNAEGEARAADIRRRLQERLAP